MKKYSVEVSVNINGVSKEMVFNNVYAKNEGHAGWCAMARAKSKVRKVLPLHQVKKEMVA